MRRLLLALPLMLAACPNLPVPSRPALSSFDVKIGGVYVRDASNNRTPMSVSSVCEAQYGGEAMVPFEVRGTKNCRYQIPRGTVEIDLTATALDGKGQPLTGFNGVVTYRVLPGELKGSTSQIWTTAQAGQVTATITAQHQFAEVRVWVENAPPVQVFDGGVQVELDQQPPADSTYTYAAGTSPAIWFMDQTLQSLQVPDGFDNRSSPFAGEFVQIGKNPESGEKLLQNCANDPRHDGQQALMVVTGLDPTGFYVSDITACRLIENTKDATGATQVRTPEPPEPCLVALADGGADFIENTDAGTGSCDVSEKACHKRADCPAYLPSHYGHLFVYNYNYPQDLSQGDLLFTLSGSVQEFTSTTQLNFPAWSVAEHVGTLPEDQWNKWLQYVPTVDINGRLCGQDNAKLPYLTDILCGQNKRNLKLESNESGMVRVRGVRFPTTFKNCDLNGDGTVPFYCENPTDGSWGSCGPASEETANDTAERLCVQECVLATGPYDGVVCAEQATFTGYGQYVVEMGSPGAASAHLDDSLPLRYEIVAVSATAVADGGVTGPIARTTTVPINTDNQVSISCTAPMRYVLGSNTATIDETAPIITPNWPLWVITQAGQGTVSFQATTASGTCTVGISPKARINVVTKDAIPQLDPTCSESDADATKALNCKYLHTALFDVSGHLKQAQPARPRWVVVPRDVDDVCCYPAPGLACPTPIQPCP
jgi:hypothetical protein